MNRWAFSVMTHRLRPESKADVAHTVAVLEARTAVDAKWEAHRIGLKTFPKSEGWVDHRVKVWPGDQVVNFESNASNVKIYKTEAKESQP